MLDRIVRFALTQRLFVLLSILALLSFLAVLSFLALLCIIALLSVLALPCLALPMLPFLAWLPLLP